MRLMGVIIGATVGLMAGGLAYVVLVPYSRCIVGIEDIDPVVGLLFGIFYGVNGADLCSKMMGMISARSIQIGWIRVVDTLLGSWLGYHLAIGAMYRIEWQSEIKISLITSWLVAVGAIICFGVLFCWLSSSKKARTTPKQSAS